MSVRPPTGQQAAGPPGPGSEGTASRRSGSQTVALASKLFGSSVIAQVAALAATTLAATQTTPADFATYAAILAATAVIAAVNSLAAETRMPVVPAATSAAMNRAGATAMVLSGAVIGVAGVIGVIAGASWGLPVLLVAIGCVAVSWAGLLVALIIRVQRQHLLARNRVVQGLTNAALVSTLIFTPLPGYLVLAGSWILSTVIGGIVAALGIRDSLHGFRPARRGDWSTTFREVRLQPVNNTVAMLATSLPALLLPMFGATLIAGAWALVSRILNAVVQTVHSTVSPIYTGRAAEQIRDSEYPALAGYHSTWIKRLALLIPAMIIGIIVGVTWLLPLLGDQWLVTRDVLLPACLSFTALLVWLPVSQTLVLLGRTPMELAWSVGNLVASATPLLLVPVLGGQTALIVWAALQPLSILVHLVLQRRAILARAAQSS